MTILTIHHLQYILATDLPDDLSKCPWFFIEHSVKGDPPSQIVPYQNFENKSEVLAVLKRSNLFPATIEVLESLTDDLFIKFVSFTKERQK